MPDDMLKRFRELLGRDSGMILVTGPTGSGKTSTLYAALAEIDAEQQKIITVEDPVEYRLPGLTQVQVNDKIELDFARVLRAALRQDPDVILVGEMRDAETAEIGLRAAITGHLLLSTLHTKDTVSTPFRLLDMGAPPFMVATSLQAVLAQRLLRGVCKHCAEPHLATPQEQAWVHEVQAMNGEEPAPVQSVKGRGQEGARVAGAGPRHGAGHPEKRRGRLPGRGPALAERQDAGRPKPGLGARGQDLARRSRTHQRRRGMNQPLARPRGVEPQAHRPRAGLGRPGARPPVSSHDGQPK
jgi:MSHA biogenesis protein MshE